MRKVRNINGTADNVCRCGSWLEHWKSFSRQQVPTACPEATCLDRPEVGAHVQKEDTDSDKWYIVPLCRRHNALTGKTISICDAVPLVSAAVADTCGKR